MSSPGELRAADHYCWSLASRHYENFSVASRILPADLRLHLARVYAFCRTTDDFGDESGGAALARLGRWREETEAMLDGSAPIHPVLLALQHTVAVRRLGSAPLLDLIAANFQDQRVSAYPDWESLRAYCQLSAAPVGRMVLQVFGVNDPRAVPLSDDVCIGLQLANFAQDVGVDRAKGRTYLLGSDLQAGGTAGAVRALCDRAEILLQSGETLECLMRGRLRLQLALYRLGGLAIVEAIRRAGYATEEFRPQVSTRQKLKLLPVAVLQGSWRGGNVPAQRPA